MWSPQASQRATTRPHSTSVTVLGLNGGPESWNEGCTSASFCHSGQMPLLTTYTTGTEALVSKIFSYETKFMTDRDFFEGG